MRKIPETLLLAAMCAAMPAMAYAADYDALLPGKWEIHAVTKLSGMEGIGQLPEVEPQTQITCVTQENLNAQETVVDKFTGAGADCQKKNVNVTSRRTSWDLQCQLKGQNMTSKGKMTPHDNKKAYDGAFTVNYELLPGMALVADVSMKGTWKGECDDDTPRLEDQLKEAASREG